MMSGVAARIAGRGLAAFPQTLLIYHKSEYIHTVGEEMQPMPITTERGEKKWLLSNWSSDNKGVQKQHPIRIFRICYSKKMSQTDLSLHRYSVGKNTMVERTWAGPSPCNRVVCTWAGSQCPPWWGAGPQPGSSSSSDRSTVGLPYTAATQTAVFVFIYVPDFFLSNRSRSLFFYIRYVPEPILKMKNTNIFLRYLQL